MNDKDDIKWEDWLNHFKNYPPNYDPSYNKDGWHLSHWFGDKRHFRPWYDDDADYNTNAKSYYDYLGFRIKQLDYIICAINKLLRRDLKVQNTSSVEIDKTGDWEKGDDIINISALVRLLADVTNAIKNTPEGLYVKDLEPELKALEQTVEALQNQVNQNSSEIQKLHDGLNGLDGKIKDLAKAIQNILNRLNGKYQTIPSSNWYHKYYNGSSDVPEGWGTFKAGAIYGQNNVTLNVRIPYANHNLQNLELNGGALPLSKHPLSYVVGFGFTGEFAFLNDMKIESVQITNGAPHIKPVSARASWTIGYNFDHDRKILGGDPYQLTLATFADGYNDKNTFSEHYRGIYLKGDILTATFNLSGKVPEKFYNGQAPTSPDEEDEPYNPDEEKDQIIRIAADNPQGVPDLRREVTRTINLLTNESK